MPNLINTVPRRTYCGDRNRGCGASLTEADLEAGFCTQCHCAFEPDATPVVCVECEKPTGLMGTCQDVDFCASCKQEFIDGAMAQGASRPEAEREYSAMLIGMIEGQGYNAKYARKRVLHLSVDGKPACGIKGGPHPLTVNRNETNCKRCLKAFPVT